MTDSWVRITCFFYSATKLPFTIAYISHKFISIFKDLLIYLKGRNTLRRRESDVRGWARLKPGAGASFRSLLRVQGPSHLGLLLLLFSRASSESLMRSGAARTPHNDAGRCFTCCVTKSAPLLSFLCLTEKSKLTQISLC